ncbi:hypothetical protein EVAR_101858_1 [Eumeta japonica]|uniref:Uncharacterized protein n=1 Tax=Eumeta variegata TaxID=151549 RepID=A0A4C1SN01_EUMVA|nr:hypothetical protein EVAR_101858_1 [Eumeta japonica]
MATQLSPEMLLLLTNMTEQLNLQTKTITENITAAVLQKVDKKLQPIIEQNEKLKSEVEKLNQKIQNSKQTVGETMPHSVDSQKQKSRRSEYARYVNA